MITVLGRGIKPSGSRRRVSDHIIILPLWTFPGATFKTCTTNGIAQREALLSHLEHVHGKTIGVNLAIHISPKAMHLIALDISNGHQWPS
jgi:hypothetical protein